MPSLVIDTDTASDDAIALVLAARHPHTTLRLVTTVAGNVPVDLATINALLTLDLVGNDVEVCVGAPGPLLRPLETAQFVHGEDGMGDLGLPRSARAASPRHAVDALRQVARDEPGEHVLVTLGPLTNIATALLVEPDLLTRFARVVLMAGAFDGVGNVHPVGEYNVWTDPEAAEIVLGAAGDKTFVGWDVSRRYAVFGPQEQAQLRAAGPLGEFAVDINRVVDQFCRDVSGLVGFDLPDPIAMAAAIDPSLVGRSTPHRISIGRDDVGRGGTFIDHRHHVDSKPNGTVAWEIDETRFKAMLLNACR